jgi:hypothetical protein
MEKKANKMTHKELEGVRKHANRQRQQMINQIHLD